MALPRPAASAPESAAETRERRRLFLIGLAISVLIALPVGVSVGMSWVDVPWTRSDTRAVPDWVALPQVRATTLDGAVVKARVALDVEGAATRTAIQRRTQQVGLLLELSVATHTREQITSAKGIARLSGNMRDRLNAYLAAEGTGTVKSVAIQDLIVNPQ
jgi:flagellar basal body-associated protein FliL